MGILTRLPVVLAGVPARRRRAGLGARTAPVENVWALGRRPRLGGACGAALMLFVKFRAFRGFLEIPWGFVD